MQEDCTEVNLKQDLTKCKIVKEFQLERQNGYRTTLLHVLKFIQY